MEALDQLLYRRDEAIRVEGIIRESVRVMPGKHQFRIDAVGMADRLQRLLDAIGPRIGFLAGAALLVLRSIAEEARAKTAHAIDLVEPNFIRLPLRHKNER